MLSMISKGRIADPNVEAEFEHLIARLRGFLSQSFDEDGELVVADPNLAIMPVGGLVPFAGASAPSGYLLCDGAQVSRTTYKSLFDVIGVTYGLGDGSTTFTIPDLRQRFPLGKAAAGTGATLGATGGAIDHTHSGGSHTHTVNFTSGPGGDHTHAVNDHSHSIAHTHSGTTSDDDDFITVDNGGSFNLSVNPHSHSFTTDGPSDGTTGNSGSSTDASGNHTHAVSGTTASASGTTGAENPPFLAVNYLIFAGV